MAVTTTVGYSWTTGEKITATKLNTPPVVPRLTIDASGSLTQAGAFATILRASAATDVTLPTTGTLAAQGAAMSDDIGDIRLIPQNSKSADYTLVASDKGKHIFHPSADTTTRTWTIPANASVAYTIGTAITFVNQNSAGTLTIAITSDTLRLAGSGTTGSRTLAANGIATALKVTATEWIISGTNLT